MLCGVAAIATSALPPPAALLHLPPPCSESTFQGGVAVEVFGANGSNPVANWKVAGSVQKVYEKAVKGYVYRCDGGPSAKMQLPKDDRRSLGLVQPYLVLQLHVPEAKPFSLELSVTDTARSRRRNPPAPARRRRAHDLRPRSQARARRRLLFSTSFREVMSNPLHTRVPLGCLARGVWVNPTFDLTELTAHNFGGARFSRLESIAVGAVCKLRRIFTLRDAPAELLAEEVRAPASACWASPPAVARRAAPRARARDGDRGRRPFPSSTSPSPGGSSCRGRRLAARSRSSSPCRASSPTWTTARQPVRAGPHSDARRLPHPTPEPTRGHRSGTASTTSVSSPAGVEGSWSEAASDDLFQAGLGPGPCCSPIPYAPHPVGGLSPPRDGRSASDLREQLLLHSSASSQLRRSAALSQAPSTSSACLSPNVRAPRAGSGRRAASVQQASRAPAIHSRARTAQQLETRTARGATLGEWQQGGGTTAPRRRRRRPRRIGRRRRVCYRARELAEWPVASASLARPSRRHGSPAREGAAAACRRGCSSGRQATGQCRRVGAPRPSTARRSRRMPRARRAGSRNPSLPSRARARQTPPARRPVPASPGLRSDHRSCSASTPSCNDDASGCSSSKSPSNGSTETSITLHAR